ncbi:uncharacterized protein MKK02DRAFT_38964 [Dioszegia hungarica]|uniref:Uncharacterized protein n=1 Tax=Dioszegia hungarica TaxID=4972 RepID=A0AA38LT19_9TREE|nr:uncharacterized protein MKK02DRAFT_38964 [Dioszegia hungarica]KAI9634290.1 hypothetical protein MKK02DRAFT_38964 [Dioszegia hungarica]
METQLDTALSKLLVYKTEPGPTDTDHVYNYAYHEDRESTLIPAEKLDQIHDKWKISNEILDRKTRLIDKVGRLLAHMRRVGLTQVGSNALWKTVTTLYSREELSLGERECNLFREGMMRCRHWSHEETKGRPPLPDPSTLTPVDEEIRTIIRALSEVLQQNKDEVDTFFETGQPNKVLMRSVDSQGMEVAWMGVPSGPEASSSEREDRKGGEVWRDGKEQE